LGKTEKEEETTIVGGGYAQERERGLGFLPVDNRAKSQGFKRRLWNVLGFDL